MATARLSLKWRGSKPDPSPTVGWSLEDCGYVRPPISSPTILDDEGVPIPYGHRWTGLPPDDMYSVVRHPERFEPLATTADALISFIQETYDAKIEITQVRDRELKSPILNPDVQQLRKVVTLTPRRPDSAPLTIIVTDFPSVEVEGGMFFRQVFPDCGCDACDEDWESVADMLENIVFAIVNGTFSESLKDREVETRVWYPLGSSAGACRRRDLPYSTAYVTQGYSRLKSLPNGWQPWPRRDGYAQP